jgi:chloride channel protein, CIC family
VPPYTFEDWQLLAAIPLGLFAALVTTLSAGFIMLASWLFGRLNVPAIAKSALGGVVFGIVGVALPLTMFSGDDQLHSVLDDAGTTLGLGLLVAILIAKMLTYAVSQGSGFVGGPIFPSLFLGGTAGVIVHRAIPGVPLGLAFTCLLPAVLGTLAAAPFAMVLLTAFLTRVGALQTAPILIGVATAFLAVQAMRYLLASRRRARIAASANDSAQKLFCIENYFILPDSTQEPAGNRLVPPSRPRQAPQAAGPSTLLGTYRSLTRPKSTCFPHLNTCCRT